MILTPIFNRFRISEYIQFFSDTATICSQSNPKELNIEAQFNEFNRQQKSLEESFKQNRKSEITALLTKLDERRDRALVCISIVADGFLNHFNPRKQDAAQKISDCISKYGSKLYTLNYQAETSVLTSLGEDLQGELSESVNLLHLNEVVDEMNAANTEFNEKFIDRIDETSMDDSESTSNLIKLTLEKYKVLCRHIDAHATITPSEQYTNLIKRLNALIERYNSTMALRNNDKTDETIINDQEAA
ncbi:MAG: hypothetical protein JXB49_08245 [Bacteroidales bacterium]|nr:hypothetical protein [Bacteroidales bacterium]